MFCKQEASAGQYTTTYNSQSLGQHGQQFCQASGIAQRRHYSTSSSQLQYGRQEPVPFRAGHASDSQMNGAGDKLLPSAFALGTFFPEDEIELRASQAVVQQRHQQMQLTKAEAGLRKTCSQSVAYPLQSDSPRQDGAALSPCVSCPLVAASSKSTAAHVLEGTLMVHSPRSRQAPLRSSSSPLKVQRTPTKLLANDTRRQSNERFSLLNGVTNLKELYSQVQADAKLPTKEKQELLQLIDRTLTQSNAPAARTSSHGPSRLQQQTGLQPQEGPLNANSPCAASGLSPGQGESCTASTPTAPSASCTAASSQDGAKAKVQGWLKPQQQQRLLQPSTAFATTATAAEHSSLAHSTAPAGARPLDAPREKSNSEGGSQSSSATEHASHALVNQQQQLHPSAPPHMSHDEPMLPYGHYPGPASHYPAHPSYYAPYPPHYAPPCHPHHHPSVAGYHPSHTAWPSEMDYPECYYDGHMMPYSHMPEMAYDPYGVPPYYSGPPAGPVSAPPYYGHSHMQLPPRFSSGTMYHHHHQYDQQSPPYERQQTPPYERHLQPHGPSYEQHPQHQQGPAPYDCDMQGQAKVLVSAPPVPVPEMVTHNTAYSRVITSPPPGMQQTQANATASSSTPAGQFSASSMMAEGGALHDPIVSPCAVFNQQQQQVQSQVQQQQLMLTDHMLGDALCGVELNTADQQLCDLPHLGDDDDAFFDELLKDELQNLLSGGV